MPQNVFVCERMGQELYLRKTVGQAQRVFSQICPNTPFWPPLENEEDEEEEAQSEILRAVASALDPMGGGNAEGGVDNGAGRAVGEDALGA
ncbi:unnamed protein product [Discosporangium mesarthrocarpum]